MMVHIHPRIKVCSLHLFLLLFPYLTCTYLCSASKSMPEQVPLTELGSGETTVSITVIGASGDLAKKKIFPALFALFYEDCLPEVKFHISNCILLSTNHAQKQLELRLISRHILTILEDSAVAHDVSLFVHFRIL